MVEVPKLPLNLVLAILTKDPDLDPIDFSTLRRQDSRVASASRWFLRQKEKK